MKRISNTPHKVEFRMIKENGLVAFLEPSGWKWTFLMNKCDPKFFLMNKHDPHIWLYEPNIHVSEKKRKKGTPTVMKQNTIKKEWKKFFSFFCVCMIIYS